MSVVGRLFGRRPSIEVDLQRIDSWLCANRPDFHSALRPGVSDDDIAALETAFRLKLPDDFRSLYRWHDGQELAAGALVHNHQFLPLADVQLDKAELDDMIGFDFDDPEWWKMSWMPFTRSYGGDSYCVDVAHGSRVIAFWHDEAQRGVEAQSLAAWIADLAAVMDDGSYEAD